MNPLQNLRDVIGRIERQLKAPVAQRDKFEREMERKLGRIWKEQRDELMRLLGDLPLFPTCRNPTGIMAGRRFAR